ncbi:MAG TPA: Hpt domain-containing protein [Polyangiaceae bacterium]|jgi:HPt (histidine-containing phosphotransfer) domain-containing protein
MTGARDPAIDALLAAARMQFAGSLPAKTADVEALVAGGAWAEARRAAHKLRGSAGTYGFAALGAAAGAIEDTILEGNDGPDAEARSRIARRLEEMRVEADRAAREAR